MHNTSNIKCANFVGTLGRDYDILIQAIVCRQRPYHVENTGSRLITAVKKRRAWLVLGWVTAWEHHVLLALFFFSFFFSYTCFLPSFLILKFVPWAVTFYSQITFEN